MRSVEDLENEQAAFKIDLVGSFTGEKIQKKLLVKMENGQSMLYEVRLKMQRASKKEQYNFT